jgi:hypothetical protein
MQARGKKMQRPLPAAVESLAMTRILGVLLFASLAFAQPKRPVQEFETSAGIVKITPIQHASLVIEAGGQVVDVDPVGGGNYAGIPAADLILITDIHGDHMDPKFLPKISKSGTVILAPSAVAETVKTAKVIRNGETQSVGLGCWGNSSSLSSAKS